ncbi:MAG: J domain-containing protein [Chitinophagaceae bacterium]
MLELSPAASLDDIKRSYRRLAQRYHPDKSGSDPEALLHFAAIKEAYETLTQPGKRADYMEQRWYARSQGQSMNTEVSTASNLLRSLLDADRRLTRIDTHRTDYYLLLNGLEQLLDEPRLELLQKNNDTGINNEVVLTGLRIASRLPYPHSIAWLHRLQYIPATPELRQHILRFQKRTHRRAWWEKRMPYFVFAAAALICLLFVLLSDH